ncbi:MAG: hypothetical protein AB1758_13950 [Candidatus Eremiobacterota bacterium]
MLINTLGQGNQQAQMASRLKENQQQFFKKLGETADLYNQRADPRMTQRFDWNFEPPPFPEQSHKNLQKMQENHQSQRQNFQANLKQKVDDLKQDFFAKQHYQTVPGPDGRPQLAMGENGQPLLEMGPENAEQKEARETWEGQKKSDLNEKQTAQKDNFLKSERQDVQKFLMANATDLGNPAVQAELQRMIVNTQKKAFQLQQNHEDERWKCDLPPDAEIAATVEGGLAQMRTMEQQQQQLEENSPEMKDLMDHEQSVAALLGEQKELARTQKEDDSFLVDPRKAMAARSQPVTDFAQVLPGYLTNALYNMEIYSIEQPSLA